MSNPTRRLCRRLLVCAVCATLAAIAACARDSAGPEQPHVVFVTQPSTAVAGEPIEPPVEVLLRAASGRSLSGTVTLELDPNPCGWELAGTLTRQVTGTGTPARFADLVLDKVGQGFTLRATSGGASAMSAPFDVVSGIVAEPLVLEKVLCLEGEVHGDGESLTYVPEDNSFWIADDNRELIYEVDRLTGAYGSIITQEEILEALPDAGQCDDGDGDPGTACSYVDNFELMTYDPAAQSLYLINSVDRSTDRPAIFRLAKEACAGCFTPESWQPLPVGPSYRSIVVAAGQVYLAFSGPIYAYDYDSNQLATVDANGDSLPPTYKTSSSEAGMSFDGTFMWILTRSRVLYQVEWATRTEHRNYELDAFGFSLPRGLAVVRDTIYIVEGDSPNQIYTLSQRQP